MKKYLLLITVLFFTITTKVSALTFDGDYVYTTGGTEISLEDYKLVRKFFKFKDEMFDILDTDIKDHYIGLAHSRVYTNDYLFKVSFRSKDSSSWSEVSFEEGLRMLKENIEETIDENKQLNMAVISAITTFIVIILFFIIKKWKKQKEVK